MKEEKRKSILKAKGQVDPEEGKRKSALERFKRTS